MTTTSGFGRLTLRSRLVMMAAITTGLVAIAVSLFGYVLARRNVTGEVDASLGRDLQRYSQRLETKGSGLGLQLELATTPVFLVSGDGRVLRSTLKGSTSVTSLDIAVARGNRSRTFSDRVIDGKRFRFETAPARVPVSTGGRLARFDRANGGVGLAIGVGREVEAAEVQLQQLALGFSVLAAIGTTLSAIAALFVVRVGTRPLKDLSQIVHAISTDGDSPFVASTRGPSDMASIRC
jgi:hypothetical protein